MKIQVISDIGDDVYATVSTEEDAIRIDNAMNILYRGNASRIRSNPSDSELLAFAQEHKLDSIGHILNHFDYSSFQIVCVFFDIRI